jgi:hypothetical protein
MLLLPYQSVIELTQTHRVLLMINALDFDDIAI